ARYRRHRRRRRRRFQSFGYRGSGHAGVVGHGRWGKVLVNGSNDRRGRGFGKGRVFLFPGRGRDGKCDRGRAAGVFFGLRRRAGLGGFLCVFFFVFSCNGGLERFLFALVLGLGGLGRGRIPGEGTVVTNNDPRLDQDQDGEDAPGTFVSHGSLLLQKQVRF